MKHKIYLKIWRAKYPNYSRDWNRWNRHPDKYSHPSKIKPESFVPSPKKERPIIKQNLVDKMSYADHLKKAGLEKYLS